MSVLPTSRSIPGIQVDGDQVYASIEVNEFPEKVFRDLLNRDYTDENTRSQTLQFRLPNGDLILGFFPQGDSYFEIEEYFL